MRMYDMIEKKRLSHSLSRDEIAFIVDGFSRGAIPDYQMSAFLMAALLNGMDDSETLFLTEAMLRSGDSVDLSQFGDITADKHSTGGVGDKTSLVVIPIASACGVICAKMSGRGLGHTGGTIDKLESIDGYNAELDAKEFFAQVRDIGVAIVSQTGNLVPADKKMYALRDVTATVDSVPLIASSIMSKKLASGARSIVLDVKCGSGAFMKSAEDAARLARAMVDIGKGAGRCVTAYITDMDRVLGSAVGNGIEVMEAIDVLRGEGPSDVREICIALSSQMISSALKVSLAEATLRAKNALDSGEAYNRFTQWVRAQGARFDPDFPEVSFKTAKYIKEIKAETEGYISFCDCEGVGKCACILGAGRTSKDDVIDPAAGLRVMKKTGETISVGDVLALLYTNDDNTLDAAEALYRRSNIISDSPVEASPLILDRVD